MIRNLLILCMVVVFAGSLGLNGSIAQDGKEAPSTDKVEAAKPSQQESDTDASPKAPAEEMSQAEASEAGPKYTKWTALVGSITIFVLAVFVGFEIITKVPPTLHTPLMSGSNAISGISIVGALLSTALGANWFASFLGLLAIIMATVNVVGGYMVTHRMLSMFQKR
ncbi:NAD(P) transhydrogenase subunit alpha [Bremerella volcania]|uniref:proton-translocating NAD(P)(+) transhydrogenase n=2 Tax=Bremerella volcania TaxID=2527984 RepID=A0A518CCY1_9BACT|nr:NAD(P) transhydrogenase subunit alpha [Bremerella volcania]QDU77076.1 NAD(P) transhydrogenase subunit alpha [Bremerella volcania]